MNASPERGAGGAGELRRTGARRSSAAACTSARSTPGRARSASRRSGCSAAPHYDLHRLGFFFTPAPRHADLLLVTGPTVRAFDAAARKTFEAMPGPKVVVAVGACALGGVYPKDPFVHGNVGEVLPVDVWIPGCPPSPLALLQGLSVAVGRLAERTPGLTFIAGGDG